MAIITFQFRAKGPLLAPAMRPTKQVRKVPVPKVISEYMSKIGALGGAAGRRHLSSEEARRIVSLRWKKKKDEARMARMRARAGID